MNWLATWTIKRKVNNLLSFDDEIQQVQEESPSMTEQISDLAQQAKDKCQETYESTTNWFKRTIGWNNRCTSRGCNRQTYPKSKYCLSHKCQTANCTRERL